MLTEIEYLKRKGIDMKDQKTFDKRSFAYGCAAGAGTPAVGYGLWKAGKALKNWWDNRGEKEEKSSKKDSKKKKA